eukprot:3596604-Pyramimonas_sp.AAC.2
MPHKVARPQRPRRDIADGACQYWRNRPNDMCTSHPACTLNQPKRASQRTSIRETAGMTAQRQPTSSPKKISTGGST